MSKILKVNEFDDAIKEGIVIVDFFADWCGPCKMLAPIFEELEEEMKDKVKFFKVNVDESGELASKFSVFSIPTMIIFKDGKDVSTEVGFLPKEKIKMNLEKYI
ncbi:thioredoxin [Clostridium botulinum]|uniref:Thioredoxin n=2 Tax=Clostridium botulinum TaxID=1491 RepID=B2TQD8_CLOBB|nr:MULTISPECIES: thioredoxin [Clostridium]ACD22223.1 thioredoxin [Clostridium botulinum B str. Eklund 17B (NRP)]AIY79108.1 thioredoxin [Clostridium botulinum 202F]ACD51029.1 thioredoxin [Clostridium botulinum E3 str. Alaska E43]AJF30762.1 thioredoxin [Clostridium botulinum]AJF33825.1 thioredoxin [Clostridium botulinum]